MVSASFIVPEDLMSQDYAATANEAEMQEILAEAPPAASGKMNKKVLISGMLGNGLEWYDYALYGHMAFIFSRIFFPSDGDPSMALILTYLTFAAGFISRPVGAVIFGRIGDKYGRKKSLVAAMILMAIPTGCIGLLPTYDMIGYAAPLLLLTIRILQGLSLGGAFSGSISYVVEHAPPAQRGRIGSVMMLSLVIGFLFGSMVSTIFANVLSPEDFESWGWRIPFFLGVGIGLVGFYIREHGEESPVYEEAKKSGTLSQTPLKDAFTKHPMRMFEAFSIYLFVTIPFYMISIYMISYSQSHLGLTSENALLINSVAMASMFLTIWPAAKLCDRYGRKPVLMTAILLMLALTAPAFHMMQGGEFMSVLLGQVILGLILGIYLAPVPAVLVEIFPTSIRFTGMSLSYNFCAIIGGFTPSAAEYLIRETGSTTGIMYLLIFAGVCSLTALLFYKDRWREALR
jgi:MHS family proline/betaine transporter-like MFS transporter